MAVAAVAWVIVTVQFVIPEQAPLHPVKAKPLEVEVVSATAAPLRKSATQGPAGQEIPAGALVTAPVPITVTVSG